MAELRHLCPGNCGRSVARSMLACRDCWRRLPTHLQTAVNETWALRRRSPADPGAVEAHRGAVAEALDWCRANIGGRHG